MCIFICFQIFFQKASPFFLKAMASVLPLTSQVRAGAYGHQIASGLVIPTMGQSLKMRLISLKKTLKNGETTPQNELNPKHW